MGDRTANFISVLLLFVAYSAVVGLVPFLYFRYHRNIPLKRRVHKWQAILAGTFMFLFATFTTRLSVGLLILIPLALITFLNVRSVIVSDTCGRMITPKPPFSWRWHHWKCAERDPDKFH